MVREEKNLLMLNNVTLMPYSFLQKRLWQKYLSPLMYGRSTADVFYNWREVLILPSRYFRFKGLGRARPQPGTDLFCYQAVMKNIATKKPKTIMQQVPSPASAAMFIFRPSLTTRGNKEMTNAANGILQNNFMLEWKNNIHAQGIQLRASHQSKMKAFLLIKRSIMYRYH